MRKRIKPKSGRGQLDIKGVIESIHDEWTEFQESLPPIDEPE